MLDEELMTRPDTFEADTAKMTSPANTASTVKTIGANTVEVTDSKLAV
jgi:hypothetical protein